MKPDTFAEKESAMERFLKQLIPGIAGLLIVILGAYIVWFSSAKVSHDSGDWGTLGDYFGGLMNPVISFATLMVAFAVWKQQKVELRETKVALEEQAKTAEQQRQEQRFFDLLTVLQRVESSLRFTTPTRDRIDLHGKNAIQQRLNHLPIEFSITFKLGLGQKFNLGGNEIEITHSHLKNEWP